LPTAEYVHVSAYDEDRTIFRKKLMYVTLDKGQCPFDLDL